MQPQSSISPEEWRPVVGYEGWYIISNLGRLQRIHAGLGTWPGRILRGNRDRYGYLWVRLYRDGQYRSHKVHQLAAQAFLGPPLGREVNHKNGIKADNRVENLEWVTVAQNRRHAFATGLQVAVTGERTGSAKLKWADILVIRAGRGKITQQELADRYGVSDSAICRAQTGRNWKRSPEQRSRR